MTHTGHQAHIAINMAATYMTTFTLCFKSEEIKATMLAFMKSEDGLAVTRNAKGFVSVEGFVHEDNALKVTLLGKWENKQSYDDYLASRGITKDYNPFDEKCSEPTIITRHLCLDI